MNKSFVKAFAAILLFGVLVIAFFDGRLGDFCGAATTAGVEQIEAEALKNPKVKKAEAFIYGDIAVIAVRTDAIYFASENAALKETIKNAVLRAGFREVYVTKDSDIFLKIAEADAAYSKNRSNTEYSNAKMNILDIVKKRNGA
jgi:hypothetical protein